ncbi:DsbA family protein [Pantoea sp. Mhis]|uniref:DsbA family protein n=1 Tax=Pantoea sp. Mhis TaxID=2576759 RepID=UPI00135C2620|nr:DsbA family protein [Pantoea sp. Mhis]MXP56669.1 thiol:disulfide interchange protein DsbA [Pantoea sp. Mhis]
MKNIVFTLIGLILSFNTLAIQFNEGKQYITLSKPHIHDDTPQALEFFSFFCSYCYQFEHVYHISDVVKKNLPVGIKLVKYHVDFLGNELGQMLTHAWAIAITLGVEDKVILPLFDEIQKKHAIFDEKSLKQAFIKAAGISSKQYDIAWNSLSVKSLVAKQQKATIDMNLQAIPEFFVNGKYMVNIAGLYNSNINKFVNNYAKLVVFLINKK